MRSLQQPQKTRNESSTGGESKFKTNGMCKWVPRRKAAHFWERGHRSSGLSRTTAQNCGIGVAWFGALKKRGGAGNVAMKHDMGWSRTHQYRPVHVMSTLERCFESHIRNSLRM